MRANLAEVAVGAEVEIQGAHWPVGQTVHIKLIRPEQVQALPADPNVQDLTAVKVGDKGTFKQTVKIPAAMGWEAGGDALVVAHTDNYERQAVAAIRIIAQPPTDTPEPPPPPPEQEGPEPPPSEPDTEASPEESPAAQE